MGGISERIIAGKWIAGADVSDAIRRARQLNALGMSATINFIGEDLTDKREINEMVSTNLRLIREIRKAKLQASISLKLTALGLRMSKRLARKNYGRILKNARKHGVFVWLDAESQDTIEPTISIYESQSRKGGSGIALQSYLRRSGKDMERLIKKKAVIRLVKGAYKESDKIAFQTRREVTENFRALMREAFAGLREFTIATHDGSLISEAIEMNRSHRRRVTYSMLNGIRNEYAEKLTAQGHSVSIYVPFGTRWVGYALRRLREESHLILILRSLLGG